MPANLKDLRNRIKSIKNTQQITKAMKLVSAARFGRAQSAVVSARPYATYLGTLVTNLAQAVDNGADTQLVKDGASNVVLVVVVSSERGLCGGYNSNITKIAIRTIEELHASGKEVAICCVGKKAYQTLTKRFTIRNQGPTSVSIKDYLADPGALINTNQPLLISASFDRPTFDQVAKLTEAVAKIYELGLIGKAIVVYNKFQSAMTQIPTADTVLPMQFNHASEAGLVTDMVVEPSVSELLDAAVPRYLATQMFQVFLEAIASEHGARMTAMDNATRNAKDMQRRFEVTYQRARQAAITNELIEIISGAEAL